jgi:hypothetical protein
MGVLQSVDKPTQTRKEIKMKHLNLELEKLEQRIAPGRCSGGGGSASSGSKSGGSKSGGSNSSGSKSGGSDSSGSKSGGSDSCGSKD